MIPEIPFVNDELGNLAKAKDLYILHDPEDIIMTRTNAAHYLLGYRVGISGYSAASIPIRREQTPIDETIKIEDNNLYFLCGYQDAIADKVQGTCRVPQEVISHFPDYHQFPRY